MLAHSHPLQGDFNRKQHQDLIIQTGTRETDVGLHLSQEGIPLNCDPMIEKNDKHTLSKSD